MNIEGIALAMMCIIGSGPRSARDSFGFVYMHADDVRDAMHLNAYVRIGNKNHLPLHRLHRGALELAINTICIYIHICVCIESALIGVHMSSAVRRSKMLRARLSRRRSLPYADCSAVFIKYYTSRQLPRQFEYMCCIYRIFDI